jgi:hypothetical protein
MSKPLSKRLSKEVRDFILGSLLGDGSIAINKNYRHARFSFRHSIVQKDYFFWKVEMLKEISHEKCVWIQGQDKSDGFGTIKYRFQSMATPLLDEIFYLTHGNGPRTPKKVTRRWLNQLTPLSLAVWWCDDGSLVSDTRQGVFCTDGFSLDEVKIIDRYMKKVWHLSTKIVPTDSSKQKYRVWLRSTEDLQSLLRIIMPFVKTKDMLKKILLLYKEPLLQQRWISEIVNCGNFTKKEVETMAIERKKKLKNFQIKI